MANSLPNKSQLLGQSLKWLRESKKETLAEAAGAIEVDTQTLERYEDGQEMPSEDILLLMFNHFEVDDEQATRLRRLAGYQDNDAEPQMQMVKMPIVLLGMESKVVYSDSAHIEINPEGVVITFAQGQNPTVPVSRVGMSHTQAENVLKTLEQAMLRMKYLAGPRALPPAKDTDQK